MKFVQKYADVLIALLLVFLVGIIPVTKFIINMMNFLHTYGESEVGLGVVDIWEYMLWVVDGAWFIYLLPVLIPILSTFRYHKDYHLTDESLLHNNIKTAYLRAFVLVLGYSGMLLVVALIVPTLPTNRYVEQPFMWILFFHLNVILYSVFLTTLGLIMMTLIKKYYLALLSTVGTFIILTLFFFALGGIFEEIFPTPFTGDWFWIYNFLAFDSGMPEYFGTGMLLILCGISIVVFSQLIKEEQKE
jgi:hypothetical protein